MSQLEILRQGFDDNLSILSPNEMDNIVGGDTNCNNVFPICGGGCPIDRNRNKGKSTKTYCTYYKKYLSEMLPYLYEYRRNNKS